MFTTFDKAIAALVVAALAILSLAFKADLSGYGDIVTGVLTALVPAVVYLVPNLKVVEDGANATAGKIIEVVTDVATSVGQAAAKPKAAQ